MTKNMIRISGISRICTLYLISMCVSMKVITLLCMILRMIRENGLKYEVFDGIKILKKTPLNYRICTAVFFSEIYFVRDINSPINDFFYLNIYN